MYGPVRTVVWQGSVGDRRPYADQVGLEETSRHRVLFALISAKPVSGPRQNLFPVGRLLESKVFHASRHLYGSGVRKP